MSWGLADWRALEMILAVRCTLEVELGRPCTSLLPPRSAVHEMAPEFCKAADTLAACLERAADCIDRGGDYVEALGACAQWPGMAAGAGGIAGCSFSGQACQADVGPGAARTARERSQLCSASPCLQVRCVSWRRAGTSCTRSAQASTPGVRLCSEWQAGLCTAWHLLPADQGAAACPAAGTQHNVMPCSQAAASL